MSAGLPSLVVAVLTYRRPDDLAELLPLLAEQLADVERLCDPRVLVVDNDPNASGEPAAAAASGGFAKGRFDYVVEPTPGIAAARNRALDEACDTDLLVFIDDDERPRQRWLSHLVDTARSTGASAVAGTVESRFEAPLPPWIAAGDFFRRRRLPTGTVIDVAATNNLLLDLRAVRDMRLRFDLSLGLTGGEDTLFTRTLHAGGRRMVWCAEAVVTDRVPPSRMTRRWVLARAFSSGNSRTRVALKLADGRSQRVRARVDAVGTGLPRLVAGLLRHAAGLAVRSRRHQAMGLRTACRGAGMLAGAVGHRYQEYRRTDQHDTARPARSREVAS